MAKLAIKGHETRGAEVIALLEMLGGINDGNLYGDLENAYYFIGNLNEIDAGYVSEHDNSKQYLLYSLEEFEKRFPYKVGDKVLITHDVTKVYTITSMTWSGLRVAYKIKAFSGIDNVHEWFAYELKPYKEQIEDIAKTIINAEVYAQTQSLIDRVNSEIKYIKCDTLKKLDKIDVEAIIRDEVRKTVNDHFK